GTPAAGLSRGAARGGRGWGGGGPPRPPRRGRAWGERAGGTPAVPWKLMVAGGIGATSDKIPPRRTSTVTATRPSAATCRAFQLPGATATTSLRPVVLYMTPLDRGSPAGVTWLSTA